MVCCGDSQGIVGGGGLGTVREWRSSGDCRNDGVSGPSKSDRGMGTVKGMMGFGDRPWSCGNRQIMNGVVGTVRE